MIAMSDDNKPKTLAQMAAETAALESSGGSPMCPECGCRDFRPYRTNGGTSSIYRYEMCRHCGHKVITAAETVKRIVRDVESRS